MTSAHYLVVGYPGLVARAVLRVLEQEAPEARVDVLVKDPARHRVLEEDARARGRAVRLWQGSVEAIDCGLSGSDYMSLSAQVERIVWCFEPSSVLGKHLERAPCVRGASELVELVRVCKKLSSAVYLSSIFALGRTTGEVLESELSVGQKFDGPSEEAWALAERIVERELARFPITIARAAPALGDAETGQCPEDGALVRLVQALRGGPAHVGASFSGEPVHVVTSDWLSRALVELSQNERARHRRLHLVDPEPTSDARFFELVASACGRLVEERPPKGMRARPESPLSRLPVPEAKALRGWDVRWDVTGSGELLGALPLPRVEEYVPRLVEWCSGERDGALA